MSGRPPKALPSTGPHSLRDMPHPLAGSSSEEAVGGDSTPSPDLLMARSFGDKVGHVGLGIVSLPRETRYLEHHWARAAPTLALLSGGRRALAPEPWENYLSAAPAGSLPQGERTEGTELPGCDWSRAPVTAGGEGSRLAVVARGVGAVLGPRSWDGVSDPPDTSLKAELPCHL